MNGFPLHWWHSWLFEEGKCSASPAKEKQHHLIHDLMVTKHVFQSHTFYLKSFGESITKQCQGGWWNEVTMEEWLIHWFSFFPVKKMKHPSLHCKICFSSHFWMCVVSMKQLSFFLFRLHITSWPRHSAIVSEFHLFWMLTWESLALNTAQCIKLKLNILFHSGIFLWKGSRH